VVVVIRASAAWRSASVIFCLLTSLSRLLETTDMPRVSAASEMSDMTT
jgi:hypothetical protein